LPVSFTREKRAGGLEAFKNILEKVRHANHPTIDLRTDKCVRLSMVNNQENYLFLMILWRRQEVGLHRCHRLHVVDWTGFYRTPQNLDWSFASRRNSAFIQMGGGNSHLEASIDSGDRH